MNRLIPLLCASLPLSGLSEPVQVEPVQVEPVQVEPVQVEPVQNGFPGKKSKWYAYDRYDFILAGQGCYVVVPKQAAEGKPWIWRARFPNVADNTDQALVARGFHIGFIDTTGMYGNPAAVKKWDAFYKAMTGKHGLSRKPALIGVGVGALVMYNWAIENPEKVACIYGDAPVTDIKSWPGGKMLGKGDELAWKECLAAYGMTDAQALLYRKNPVDRVEVLAESGVPIIHVVGRLDFMVPVSENTEIIRHTYRKLGGTMLVHAKQEGGHLPMGLENPAPIVQFILRNVKRK